MTEKLNFPKDFFWGASTAAYQVEGGIENCDWAKVYPAGKACDHYNRFEGDFDLAKKLNHNAHRFSIEWSRIEPEEGKFDEKEIEHYRQVILALKKRGIKPFVCLWHWTNPLWIRDKGGWESREVVDCFCRYAEKVVSSLEGVDFWVVLNEPELNSFVSYLEGRWPPKKKSVISLFRVVGNLIRAHRGVYKIIKKIQPEARVGIASNNTYYEAYKKNWLSSLVKKNCESFGNFYFLDRIKNYQDFVGLNYYFHNRIKGFKFNQNENKVVTDMGWEIYPQGIYFVLKNLRKYGKPIYILENGLADAQDKFRKDFISKHLYWVCQAMAEGIDVKGYFHWSLLDNFEWADGFGPRFGLIEVDYKTMERKIRPSAFEYAKICRENSLNIEQ